MEGVLLVIGNPLLDISAPVPQDLLDKYGLKAGNAILAEPSHVPLYEELVKNYQVEYIAGGAGQNSARGAQWMLQAPKAVGYIGCIGNDSFGKILKEAAEKDGVSTHYLVDQSTPTGTCAVLVREKERSLVANLSAANKYKKEHFESQEIQAVVQKAQFYYFTGFFLTVSPETAIELGQYCATNNKPLLFNLSAPFLINFFWDGKMEVVLRYADVVFSNEDEAAALGAKLGWGSDLMEIAKKLADFPKENKNRNRLVVFTQGAKSTIVCHEGKITNFQPIPVRPEEIVDTNGAGDSFVGGFLSRFVQNKPLEECVAAGHYCACECIKRSGCTYPPTPQFTYQKQ
jgi:adenosine kinase